MRNKYIYFLYVCGRGRRRPTNFSSFRNSMKMKINLKLIACIVTVEARKMRMKMRKTSETKIENKMTMMRQKRNFKTFKSRLRL
jgi:hypothetical protein